MRPVLVNDVLLFNFIDFLLILLVGLVDNVKYFPQQPSQQRGQENYAYEVEQAEKGERLVKAKLKTDVVHLLSPLGLDAYLKKQKHGWWEIIERSEVLLGKGLHSLVVVWSRGIEKLHSKEAKYVEKK